MQLSAYRPGLACAQSEFVVSGCCCHEILELG